MRIEKIVWTVGPVVAIAATLIVAGSRGGVAEQRAPHWPPARPPAVTHYADLARLQAVRSPHSASTETILIAGPWSGSSSAFQPVDDVEGVPDPVRPATPRQTRAEWGF